MSAPRPPRLPLTREQQDLVEEALPVVERYWRRMARRFPHFDPDELWSVSQEAAAAGCRTFDPSRGKKLATYLWKCVVGAMFDAIWKDSPARLREFHALLDDAEDIVDLDGAEYRSDEEIHAYIRDAGESGAVALHLARTPKSLQVDGVAVVLDRERVSITQGFLEALPSRDADLLRMKFIDGCTWEEVAAALGTSESTVRRRTAELRADLKEALHGSPSRARRASLEPASVVSPGECRAPALR
jgi:RNA polymerase sigma factor (sigma-70 family)